VGKHNFTIPNIKIEVTISTTDTLCIAKSQLYVLQAKAVDDQVDEFITQNNFTKLASNHTNKQQNAIKTAINTCNQTIRQTDKWKYINMNPEAPHIHGTIKLPKDQNPLDQ
jgi:hypothetical protein